MKKFRNNNIRVYLTAKYNVQFLLHCTHDKAHREPGDGRLIEQVLGENNVVVRLVCVGAGVGGRVDHGHIDVKRIGVLQAHALEERVQEAELVVRLQLRDACPELPNVTGR